VRRSARALLSIAALSCSSPSPPPIARPTPSTAALPATKPTPLDALAAEAQRADMSLLVTRDANTLLERQGSSRDVFVLTPFLIQLAVHDEPVVWNVSPQLVEERVYRPLGISSNDLHGTALSLGAAERVARVVADRGVLHGKRVFPERVFASLFEARKPVWEPVGEGELAVITRPIFDSWRGIPSIDRSTLAAVEPLVDEPIAVDDFVTTLERKLGTQSDVFRNELSKAQRKLFERRWRSTVGFGAFGVDDAVVVLTRTKLIAVYVAPHDRYQTRRLIPLLRALE
jgi:hypothetical protein